MFASNDQSCLLWSQFKEGKKKALEAIYRNYINELINYGYRITTDADLIKDSIHDLFIELWKSRENLCNVVEPKFYLFKALRNKLYRALNGSSYVSLSEIKITSDALSTEFVELEIMEREQNDLRKENLQNLINVLPLRQHEVIYLRFYHNLSYESIAEIMGMNYQSVLNLMHRALGNLRKNMKGRLVE